MDITEKRKFYERVYFFELDKRERIYTRLKLSITVLIFMASINFFLITEAITLILKMPYTFIVISLFVFIIVISLCILIYLWHCIYKAFSGWTYHEVSPKDFDEYFDEDLSKAEETFEKNLTRWLMKCADHNHNINLERNAYIVRFIRILPYYPAVLALFYVFLLINTSMTPN